MSGERRDRSSGSGFSIGVMIGVILVGVFAFSAFIVLSAFEPELTSGRDGRAHALSISAVGFAGAVRLAQESGASVRVGRVTGAGDRFQSFVILTPEGEITWDEINRVSGRTTLIILPKWIVGPDPTHRGWVSRYDVYPARAFPEILREVAPDAVAVQASNPGAPRLYAAGKQIAAAGVIQNLQTVSAPSLAAVITDENAAPIVSRLSRDGRPTNIYVLSDPDFLNTQGIADLNTARAGMALLDRLREADEPIVFDVTMNGLGGARSAMRLAFTPPFLGATLAFCIGAALLAWRAALRFGPGAHVQRVIALGKTALANNSAALIRLAGREHKLGPGYARLTGAAAAEAAGFGRKDEEEAASLLDRLSEAEGLDTPFSKLAADAASAKTASQMLDAARKLHAWRKETARATR